MQLVYEGTIDIEWDYSAGPTAYVRVLGDQRREDFKPLHSIGGKRVRLTIELLEDQAPQ